MHFLFRENDIWGKFFLENSTDLQGLLRGRPIARPHLLIYNMHLVMLQIRLCELVSAVYTKHSHTCISTLSLGEAHLIFIEACTMWGRLQEQHLSS